MTASDQAARDAAYNNGAAVADSAILNRRRIEQSREFRKRPGAVLDLAYGPDARQRWDLFPAGRDAPCIVFVHGGYWQSNTREDFCCLVEGLVAHGWSAALPGYRLAPEASLTEIVADIRQALDWLQAHGRDYGIGPSVLHAGWSAGAHLVAMTLDHPMVATGLAISGIYELEPLRQTYLNEKLKLTDREVAELSPTRLPGIAKPLTISYGTSELTALVADSEDFFAARQRGHMPGHQIHVVGADHFRILDELRIEGGLLFEEALALHRHIRESGSGVDEALIRINHGQTESGDRSGKR